MTDAPTGSESAPRRQVGGRDLPTAIAVGVGLAALFLGSLFAGEIWFTIVITLLIVPAMWEAARELEKVGLQLDGQALMLAAATTVWLTHQQGEDGQVIGVAVSFALAFVVQLLDKAREDVVRRLAVTFFLSTWVGLLASYAVLLRAAPDGDILALAVIGAAILGDIGGFVVGVNFGRTKIAPRLSPNKSLEGLLGGMVISAGLAALVLPRASVLFDVPTAVAIGLVCALGGFLGDLLESMIKRDMGIKDFGSLIPGHGGVLDRVDGILLALPLGWFIVRQLIF